MILNMGGGGVVPKENLDAMTITPGTENHIVPMGTYLRGDMIISGDENLVPGNIMKGVGIFGVVGTGVEDITPIDYEYSGTSNLSCELTHNSDGDPVLTWTLKLLTSGTLRVKRLINDITDMFMVGGGGGGGGLLINEYNTALVTGGGGGGGGYTKTVLNIDVPLNEDIPIVIGAGGSAGVSSAYTGSVTKGGSGGATSAMGYTVSGGSGGGIYETFKTSVSSYFCGGSGGSGGSGGGRGGSYSDRMSNGIGQGTTTRAFGESSNTLYSGGGGGGSSTMSGDTLGYNGGSNGSDGGSTESELYSKGGAGGGGDSGKSGSTNYGGGGGGGGDYIRSAGAGGSGIVILRGRYS